MKGSLLLAGACLLALALTIAECDVQCDDAFNPTSQLATCISRSTTDPTTVCTGNCRELLEKYAETCLTGNTADQFMANINTLCSGSAPSVPSVPGSQVCSAFLDASSDLFTCNTDLAANPDSACSGDCRSALEEYVEECLSEAAADTFNDNINTVCGETEAEGGATSVGATLISTISALMVAVSAALY